jgi:hypothetical protein
VTQKQDSPRGSETPCQMATPAEQPPMGTSAPIPGGHLTHGCKPCADTAGIRPCSPVTIDGGTRFVLQARESYRTPPAWAAVVRAFEYGPAKRTVQLPVPPGPDYAHPPRAEVVISGASRQVHTFLVPGSVWWRFNTETRQLLVQLKARQMWAAGAGVIGYEHSARYWVPILHALYCCEAIELEQAFARGWRVSGVEVCCDFAGLTFERNDAALFVGARKTGDDSSRVTVWGQGDSVETLNIGKRSSPLSLCLYDKAAQIEQTKAGDGSMYAAVHRACGWQGEQLTRVELRGTGRGLQLECSSTGECLDLRDPAALCDAAAVALWWRVVCAKRRLVTPDASRLRRCSTDPRWLAVTAAATDAPALDDEWRQAREAHREAHAIRVDRSRLAALRGLARYGALHGRTIEGEPAAVELLRDALQTAPDALDLGDVGRDYARTQEQLLHAEIAQAAADLAARVDKRRARLRRSQASAAARASPGRVGSSLRQSQWPPARD